LKADLAYPDWASDESRARIMRDVDGIIADAQQRAARLFDLQPKAPVIARPFPKFRENNAAANYNAPPSDGSRPAVFQIPLRQEQMTKFGLRSLVYHETIPGHHFQIALAVENTALTLSADSSVWRAVGVCGGVGSLRGTTGCRIGLVRRRCRGTSWTTRCRTVPRQASRRRHGYSRQALDAPAGH